MHPTCSPSHAGRAPSSPFRPPRARDRLFTPPSPALRRALIIAVATGLILVTAMVAPRGAAAAGAPPACRFDDLPAPAAGYAEWASTVVDTIYRLPAGYEPPDLVPVARAGLEGDGYVRSFVVPDLRALVDAAARDGIELRAASAYRSEQTQAALLAQAEASSPAETALALVSRPGHSEHELGTTIDFGSPSGASPWPWLAENAWRYGFVLSYPADKSPATTCYAYEPWHFRYFGRQRAAEIHASGLSTREFLWRLLERADAATATGYPAAEPAGGPAGGAGGQAGSEALGARRPAAQAQSRGQSEPPEAASSAANGPAQPIEAALGVAAATGALGLLVRRRRSRSTAGVTSRTYRARG